LDARGEASGVDLGAKARLSALRRGVTRLAVLSARLFLDARGEASGVDLGAKARLSALRRGAVPVGRAAVISGDDGGDGKSARSNRNHNDALDHGVDPPVVGPIWRSGGAEWTLTC
jgi:hypothetical protein